MKTKRTVDDVIKEVECMEVTDGADVADVADGIKGRRHRSTHEETYKRKMEDLERKIETTRDRLEKLQSKYDKEKRKEEERLARRAMTDADREENKEKSKIAIDSGLSPDELRMLIQDYKNKNKSDN